MIFGRSKIKANGQNITILIKVRSVLVIFVCVSGCSIERLIQELVIHNHTMEKSEGSMMALHTLKKKVLKRVKNTLSNLLKQEYLTQ